MPPKKKAQLKYKDLGNINDMTEAELRAAMQRVLDSPMPKVDMLRRLVGRYNRLVGARNMTGVMGLLSYKGKRDVNAVLDSNR